MGYQVPWALCRIQVPWALCRGLGPWDPLGRRVGGPGTHLRGGGWVGGGLGGTLFDGTLFLYITYGIGFDTGAFTLTTPHDALAGANFITWPG